ncbi:MAG: hypothetical protein AAFW00_10305 [Bacteroidota bacterium]
MNTILGKMAGFLMIFTFGLGEQSAPVSDDPIVFQLELRDCSRERTLIAFQLDRFGELVVKTTRNRLLTIYQSTLDEYEGRVLKMKVNKDLAHREYDLNPYESCGEEEPIMDYDQIYLEDLAYMADEEGKIVLYLKHLDSRLNHVGNN